MRTFLLLLLFLLPVIPLSAQHGAHEPCNRESHPFGAFTMAGTSLNGSAAMIAGGGAGWQIDRSVAIGLSGFGLINRVKGEPAPGVARQIAFGYGGLDVRYIVDGARPYHLAFQALLGGGSASYLEGDWWGASELSRGRELPGASERDFFFILEPAVDLEANVGDDVRVSLGAGYRYIAGVSLPGLSNSALSGVSARIGFRLGLF